MCLDDKEGNLIANMTSDSNAKVELFNSKSVLWLVSRAPLREGVCVSGTRTDNNMFCIAIMTSEPNTKVNLLRTL